MVEMSLTEESEMSIYQIVCRHSRTDDGFVRMETNLRRAIKFAREHVESSYIDSAQAVVSKVAGEGSRFPGALLRTEAQYINRGGRAVRFGVC